MKKPELSAHSSLPELVEHCDAKRMAMWAAAVRSFNPLHFDYEFARQRGLSGPNVNGAFKLALFGRTIHEWLDGDCWIEGLSARYLAMDIIETDVTCTGKVTEVLEQDETTALRLDMWTSAPNGEQTTDGWAKVGLPGKIR